MKLDTPEDQAFLNSETAQKLRQVLSENIKKQFDALLNAAMESTDPKVRGIATAAVAMKQSIALLQPPKEPTE